MTCAKTICTIILCLSSVFSSLVFAQTTIEPTAFTGLLGDYNQNEKEYKERYKGYAQKNKNEIEMLFSGMFLFYKTFISSQDGTNCNFHPSCSEYGILACKKHGVLKGIPMTFDRLMRCHPFAPQKYEIDMDKRLLIDHP